jgi:prolyl oligopeptidase
MTPSMRTADRPPPTRTVEVIDDLHGTLVADPYRWLEAGADDPEVGAFITEQNAHSERYLAAGADREVLRRRLSDLWQRPGFGTPFRRGGVTFQFRNSGAEDQDSLFLLDEHGDGYPLLDPNTLSEQGTVALVSVAPSPDGRHLAYALSHQGSDWRSWHVREVATGRDLDDELRWSKFAGATWLPDGSGFLYVGYPAPRYEGALLDATLAPEIRLHRLGTEQTEDRPVYRPQRGGSSIVWPQIAHDGSVIVVTVRDSSSVGNGVVLIGPDGEADTLVDQGDASFGFLGLHGGRLLFRTDLDAPLGRVVAFDPASDDRGWSTVLPESDDLLDHVRLVGSSLVVARLHHATHRLAIVDLTTGDERPVALPEAIRLSDRREANPLLSERFDDRVTFSLWGYLTPPTPYRLDLASGRAEPLETPQIGIDASDCVTERRFVASADGTRVPLFVTRRRDLPPGPQPTLLYGYGGFGVIEGPSYRPDRLAWLERGGVFASAVLRGGGEYGATWHDGGRIEAKQNVFDDFIACAEALIADGTTAPDRLAIEGRSNGGLLVGACLTQRPELFAAALPAVGVLDMLRYHRFTIGWAWASDFGTADDPEQFAALLAYSPLHALREGERYPATLIETGDHDDRVVPAHSFKFAAALQAAQGGSAPILLRVSSGAGHGFGKPISMLVDEATDRLAFLERTLEGWA